jgi:hypothetical protein
MTRRMLFRSLAGLAGAAVALGLLPQSAQAAYYYFFQYRFTSFVGRARRRYRWRYR